MCRPRVSQLMAHDGCDVEFGGDRFEAAVQAMAQASSVMRNSIHRISAAHSCIAIVATTPSQCGRNGSKWYAVYGEERCDARVCSAEAGFAGAVEVAAALGAGFVDAAAVGIVEMWTAAVDE